MILIQFEKEEQSCFESTFHDEVYEKDFIKSKKLGGEEILFQAIITVVSIASPYIIDFFRKQHKKDKSIVIIKKGVKLVFDNEDELKKYLDKLSNE